MKIITATKQHTAEIVEHIRAWHSQSSVMKQFAFNPKKVYINLSVMLDDPNFSCRIAVNENKEILGGYSASLKELSFSYELFAQDHMFYTVPEHRSILVATGLIVDYINWAKENGAVQIRMETIAGTGTEVFEKLLKRNGFNQLGTIYSQEN